MSKAKQKSFEVGASYVTTIADGRDMFVNINRDTKGVRKLYVGSASQPGGSVGNFIIDNASDMVEITEFVQDAVAQFNEQFGEAKS